MHRAGATQPGAAAEARAGETQIVLDEGTAGIRMGGFFRRLALALNVGDLLTVPFSKDISSESVLLLHRNITKRGFDCARACR